MLPIRIERAVLHSKVGQEEALRHHPWWKDLTLVVIFTTFFGCNAAAVVASGVDKSWHFLYLIILYSGVRSLFLIIVCSDTLR